MKYINISLFFIAVLFVFTACSKEEETPLTPVKTLNVVEQMLDTGDAYTDFIKALTKSGLTNRLENSGDHTIFAPTKEAMTAYLDGRSIDDIDGSTLRSDFSYHIVRNIYLEDSLNSNGYLPTISVDGPNGNALSFYYEKQNAGILVNNSAAVTINNTLQSNGIIHSVNKVLTPPTLMDLIEFNPQFNNIGEALTLLNLTEELRIGSNKTFFAPCNDSFDGFLPEYNFNSLSDMLPDSILHNTIFYHLVNDTILFADQLTESLVKTSVDKNIRISVDTTSSVAFIVDFDARTANFKESNIYATNGILHTIDQVLSPGLLD